MSNELPAIGVLGGTGKLGAALARRWAKAGLRVLVGSRERARADNTAAAIGKESMTAVRGGTNLEIANLTEIVVLTVPYASHAEVLQEVRNAVRGKIVIDATVPLIPPRVSCAQLPPAGSSALEAQKLLGADVRLVTAFHNVAAHKLAQSDNVDCDVLVFGDDAHARGTAIRLSEAAGLRALHAGPLANSVAAEALTSVLIFINRTYAVNGAGIRITGKFAGPAQ